MSDDLSEMMMTRARIDAEARADGDEMTPAELDLATGIYLPVNSD